MRKLEEFESKTEHYQDFEEDLKEKVDKLEDDLMTYEMSLQEALTIAVDKFKEKVQGNINDMK